MARLLASVTVLWIFYWSHESCILRKSDDIGSADSNWQLWIHWPISKLEKWREANQNCDLSRSKHAIAKYALCRGTLAIIVTFLDIQLLWFAPSLTLSTVSFQISGMTTCSQVGLDTIKAEDIKWLIGSWFLGQWPAAWFKMQWIQKSSFILHQELAWD